VAPERPGGGDRPPKGGEPRPWDVPHVTEAEGSSVAPVPDAVRDAARRAFDAKAGADVADLTFDSVLDGDPPGPGAGTPGERRLHFSVEDGEGGARLTAVDHGDLVSVQVEVLPPEEAAIDVRSKGPAFTVRTDNNGVIRFDVLPGLVSLVIRPAGRVRPRPLQTAWVRL
jgi:hypothetical protein